MQHLIVCEFSEKKFNRQIYMHYESNVSLTVVNDGPFFRAYSQKTSRMTPQDNSQLEGSEWEKEHLYVSNL